MSTSNLFRPIQMGDLTLSHRVVLAPLTRFRGTDAHVPGPLAEEYYTQRASAAGTLLITEGTFIAAPAGGYPNVPGIYSDEQITRWKKITDAVHVKGSYIYLQLWTPGRAAVPEVLTKEGPYPYVSASSIQLAGTDIPPRALTIAEIKEYVQWYAIAASNAVYRAGFDGVEVHGANGYLVDLLQDVSNQRTDEYGGSVENRVRFMLEIVDAVTKAVGEKKTGIRVSPWGRFQDMGMENPIPTFSHLVTRLRDLHPALAYVHVVEPRVDGSVTREDASVDQSNDFIREIWAPRPLISAGAYTRALGVQVADQKGDLIAYGRPFIANPDLVRRLKEDIPLTIGDRSTYYVYGGTSPKGYTDYPFAERKQLSAVIHEEARL